MPYTTVEAIATGTPPLSRTQEEALAFMERVTSTPRPLRTRLPMLYRQSGIDRRFSCVEDYACDDASAFTFFGPDWSLDPAPTTGARNRRYRAAAVPLAERVARDAVAQAGLAPEDVTHVVAVTCTGFFAPGLDIELVRRLGLPPSTPRTVVGFMGCYAALNALRVADAFCRSTPGARVLVVCVELCTLHFRAPQTLEQAVINAIFADGAAAAVLAGRDAASAAGRLAYAGGLAQMDDDSMDAMTWTIGDHGFDMGLSSRVPQVLARHLPGYVERLTAAHALAPADLDFWAIHPGGRAIVDKAQAVLGLTDDDVADSLAVLRAYGNMSSPTVLFVLQRVLARHALRPAGAPPQAGLAMAFGPGLTLEGALFRTVT
jgi:predicted naringenin-chalcone synthase